MPVLELLRELEHRGLRHSYVQWKESVAEAHKRHPSIRAVLLERPAVLGLARRYLAHHDVDARCKLIDGDFFESVPTDELSLGDAQSRSSGDAGDLSVWPRCNSGRRSRTRASLSDR